MNADKDYASVADKSDDREHQSYNCGAILTFIFLTYLFETKRQRDYKFRNAPRQIEKVFIRAAANISKFS